MNDDEKRLLLLQITDSVFPIGAYTQSYGLETYVQKDMVTNGQQAECYIRNYITYSMTCTELAAIRFAGEIIESGSYEQLFELEAELNAARAAMELRMAGVKLAARFIKTVGGYVPENRAADWRTYVKGRPESCHQYVVSYGVFCALAGINR